jgi:hypothetical protein
MKITLDGEAFDVTPELVRSRLMGQVPEQIRDYWVEIDDAHWPVKQVIALATGASRSQFQSQASRRWLERLGFTIGRDGSPRLRSTAGSRRSPRPSFDPSGLETIETVDARVVFSWLRAGGVTLDGAGLPAFPPLPKQPGLYRYEFRDGATGSRTLYVGESVQLARRANNYRNAKTDRSRQRTSRRIHKEIIAHLASGGTIEFAIATRARWGEQALDFRLKSARRLAENAAVVPAQTDGIPVLNIDADLPDTEPDEPK